MLLVHPVRRGAASLQGRSCLALLRASQGSKFRRWSPEKSWVSLPHGSGHSRLAALRPQRSTATQQNHM